MQKIVTCVFLFLFFLYVLRDAFQETQRLTGVLRNREMEISELKDEVKILRRVRFHILVLISMHCLFSFFSVRFQSHSFTTKQSKRFGGANESSPQTHPRNWKFEGLCNLSCSRFHRLFCCGVTDHSKVLLIGSTLFCSRHDWLKSRK